VQLWRFNRDFLGFMEECVARHGDTFTIRPFPYDRFVVATAPVDVEAVLTDRERFAGGATRSSAGSSPNAAPIPTARTATTSCRC
jgi:hypothetical protein